MYDWRSTEILKQNFWLVASALRATRSGYSVFCHSMTIATIVLKYSIIVGHPVVLTLVNSFGCRSPPRLPYCIDTRESALTQCRKFLKNVKREILKLNVAISRKKISSNYEVLNISCKRWQETEVNKKSDSWWTLLGADLLTALSIALTLRHLFSHSAYAVLTIFLEKSIGVAISPETEISLKP